MGTRLQTYRPESYSSSETGAYDRCAVVSISDSVQEHHSDETLLVYEDFALLQREVIA
jgi:hypothetical protein